MIRLTHSHSRSSALACPPVNAHRRTHGSLTDEQVCGASGDNNKCKTYAFEQLIQEFKLLRKHGGKAALYHHKPSHCPV